MKTSPLGLLLSLALLFPACKAAEEPPPADTLPTGTLDTVRTTQDTSPEAPDTALPPLDTALPPGDTTSPEQDTATNDVAPPECVEGSDCNDFLPCTQDVCTEAGTCEHPPVPGCCTADADCDDGIPCTVDQCATGQGKCLHSFENNLCCYTAEDCNDGDACTEDACAANQCVHPQSPSPDCKCVADILCDDWNPCTSEKCLGGTCAYTPTGASGCCTNDADCDDSNPATFDACQQGICWYKPLECEVASDCQPPSPCLTGSCNASGVCEFTAAVDCCETALDCDDGHAITVDTCLNTQCVHSLGAGSTCSAEGDCFQPNACTAVTCQVKAGQCSYSPLSDAGCCTSNGDCPASAPCTKTTCGVFLCETSDDTDVTIHWASEWDDCTLGDWSVTGDGKAALWQIDDSQAISKPCSLYYGQLPAQNYDVGPTSGSILSPLITPPAGSVQLRFQRNIDTEPGQAKDLVWLDVVTEGSSTTVWDKSYEGGPGKGWKAVELDLTAIVNGPFQLRFSFDSGDGIDNGGAGVFVDDVRLVSPCP